MKTDGHLPPVITYLLVTQFFASGSLFAPTSVPLFFHAHFGQKCLSNIYVLGCNL